MNKTQNSNQSFFFYLTLSDELDEVFYLLTEALKKYDVLLLPIRVDQLSGMTEFAQSGPLIIISSIRNKRDYISFQKLIRPSLILLLRQTRFSYFQLSSFNKTRFSHSLNQKRNSFFFKYPIQLEKLSEMMVKYYMIKASRIEKWPGGVRSKLPTSIYSN